MIISNNNQIEFTIKTIIRLQVAALVVIMSYFVDCNLTHTLSPFTQTSTRIKFHLNWRKTQRIP
jgi:hypothetical protein